MVIYLDLAFLLNSISDGLALYVTARLSGRSFRWRELLMAAMLGGVYGGLCCIPVFNFARNIFVQLAVATLLVRIVFRRCEMLLRYVVLFFVLSCTLGGILMALTQLAIQYGAAHVLGRLNWKVFLLVSTMSCLFLSFIFRGGVRHAVSGQISHIKIESKGKSVHITALNDTGHTLSDPFTGEHVLTVWYDSLRTLWNGEEEKVISMLECNGSAVCAQSLAEIMPGKYRLIPYRSVGIKDGMLLCFRADEVVLDGKNIGALTIALSPTPVSEGESYVALWGGEMKEK